jgi:hypothetical protein
MAELNQHRTMNNVQMSGRQMAILALLGLFALLAVAPVLLLNGGGSDNAEDPAYQALQVFARSQNGDRTADSAAAQVYPTLQRRVVDGRELFSREGAAGICWELDLQTSDRPYETDLANCT